jgi:hypothetical protein
MKRRIEPKIDLALLLSIAFGEVGAYALIPKPVTNGTRAATTVVVKDARLRRINEQREESVSTEDH